ncbi:hypothetical protein AXG93_4510s1000 [Marchantia polymorpha subsp. ruderalis]|uniref:Uncharacterized protein n=1 Tax=Marchantia polymorpha subsp. ruderalis TaxID=1480154 RepID=A0A176WGQ1_MARPO|nr:hypothetical protein AXG93_4510s1000 [Marchantia polymorpha subsp. ruderalis]
MSFPSAHQELSSLTFGLGNGPLECCADDEISFSIPPKALVAKALATEALVAKALPSAVFLSFPASAEGASAEGEALRRRSRLPPKELRNASLMLRTSSAVMPPPKKLQPKALSSAEGAREAGSAA